MLTAPDLASTTCPIRSWGLFLLWLWPFVLSGVISPLTSSCMLGTSPPGTFLFQCPIFLPFHTVHGVLKARILRWFAIPFSSGPHSIRPLHHDPSVLGGLTRHGLVSLSQTREFSEFSHSLTSDSLQPHGLQAPPSMGFSKQGSWSGRPFPSPGDLPDPGIRPGSPALRADSLPSEPPAKPW